MVDGSRNVPKRKLHKMQAWKPQTEATGLLRDDGFAGATLPTAQEDVVPRTV